MKKLILNGIIGDEISSSIVADFLNSANGEDIEVTLNSGGGDVFEGFEVYNLFAAYAGKKTLNLGSLVASAATYIPLAFDNVIALDITNFMIHDVSTIVMGGSNEIKAEASRVEKLQNLIASKYSEVMKITPKEVNTLMHNETWYTGQEIVDAGFASELKKTGKANKSINYYKNQVKTYFNKIEEKKEIVMDKKELLNELVNQNISLTDVATKLNVISNLKSADDITKLADYENKCKEVEKLKMENTLNSIFGVNSEKNDNLPRIQAETLYKAGLDMENIKKDPIMINLMAQKAAGEVIVGKEEDKKKNEKRLNAEEY